MVRILKCAAVSAAALLLGAGAGQAQTFVSTPSIPTGFGLSGNTLGLSFSGAHDNTRPVGNQLDASIALSYGFGDPVDGIGVQVGVNITSIRRFGASGYGTLTFHRMFQTGSDGVFSVAASATYLAPWGDSARETLGGSVIGSYMFGINGRLAIATLGVANDLNVARRVEPVVGFGVAVADGISVSVGYAGNQTVIGAGWQPAALGGTSITFSVRSIEDNARRSVGIDVTRAFSFGN